MSERPYHKSIHLQNFTVFKDVKIQFMPGINAFVGENGTGKTHLMKALYAWQLATSREDYSLRETFAETFQLPEPNDLTQLGADKGSSAELHGEYGHKLWGCRLTPERLPTQVAEHRLDVARPVFIPAMDMMGHTRRFVEAYDEVRLDFDRTCRDIVTLMALQKRNGRAEASAIREAGVEYIASPLVSAFDGLSGALGGALEYDEADGRFYLATKLGRIPMPVVAEGVRKVATLLRLYQNGWLAPGTTLMWDEPEVNINPALMAEVVAAILALARSGVQVFLATHSYVILKEIEVQSRKSDKLRYFAFQCTNDGVKVNTANTYLDIDPNPIERQSADLYDRGIEKRLAGSAR